MVSETPMPTMGEKQSVTGGFEVRERRVGRKELSEGGAFGKGKRQGRGGAVLRGVEWSGSLVFAGGNLFVSRYSGGEIVSWSQIPRARDLCTVCPASCSRLPWCEPCAMQNVTLEISGSRGRMITDNRQSVPPVSLADNSEVGGLYLVVGMAAINKAYC